MPKRRQMRVADPGDAAVLEQLPHPHLCLDRAAQPRGADQPRARSALGLIDAPLPLLYNDFAIIIGLIYAYVPFMILALFSSISKLAPELREASTDLGASPLHDLPGA